MPITLYDLAGAEENRRFSPYCWRTKMALAHKGLAFETIPWRFTDKAVIAPYGSERVPVIIDNGRPVNDSWTIANYLEDTYSARPSLFGGSGGRAAARFVNAWTDNVLNPAIGPLVALDIFNHIAAADRDYFRSSREQRLGVKLEEVGRDCEARLPALRKLSNRYARHLPRSRLSVVIRRSIPITSSSGSSVLRERLVNCAHRTVRSD